MRCALFWTSHLLLDEVPGQAVVQGLVAVTASYHSHPYQGLDVFRPFAVVQVVAAEEVLRGFAVAEAVPCLFPPSSKSA